MRASSTDLCVFTCTEPSVHSVPNPCKHIAEEGPFRRRGAYTCCTKPTWPPRMGKLGNWEKLPFWEVIHGKHHKHTWCITEGWVWCITYIPTDLLPITSSHKRKAHQEPPFWKHISAHLPVVEHIRHQASCLPPLAVLLITGTADTKGKKNKGYE